MVTKSSLHLSPDKINVKFKFCSEVHLQWHLKNENEKNKSDVNM